MVGKAKRPASRYIKEWVIIDNGPGYYYVQVNSEDTNGVNRMPVKWYWDDLAGWKDSTTTDSVRHQFIALQVDQATPWVIRAKDDDGLVRGGTFQVYADGPPPRSDQVTPADASAVTGNVQFKWKKFDTHDKAETEFKVMYYKGTTQPVAVNGMDFTKGTNLSYNAADTSFSTTGTGLLAGTLNWFVIARDVRGMQTISDTLWFDHN